MRFPFPICFADVHRPKARRAKWDGKGYTGKCWLCDKSIRRDRHGRWRAIEDEAQPTPS